MDHEIDFYNKLKCDGNNAESMLTSDHMDAFINLIPDSFNTQSPTITQILSNVLPIQEGNETIQILFSGPHNFGHWICIWYDSINLRVYDSLNLGLSSEHLRIINRMFPEKEYIRVVYENVQIQEQSYNCGLFAIAFAVSIMYGICPCLLQFNENFMRTHLINMFKTNTIKMFPLRKNYHESLNIKLNHRHEIEYLNNNLQNFNEIDMIKYSQMYNEQLSRGYIDRFYKY